MRYLYFGSVEGDLQEGHFTLPHTNSPFARAQKFRFCAREARKWGVQRAKAHKNLDFVLEKPENGGSRPQKSTKMPILCSECPKTRVPKGKSAQKPRFCARNARKRGFQTPKAHKNLNFVLGKTGIGTGKRGNWHRNHNRRDAYRKRGLPANHRARSQNINTL